MTDMSVALRWISLSILFIFGAEILALLVLMGKRFFKNAFLLLDFVIVSASISLDFLFHHSEESGLIVFLRFWRFLRVAHGIYMSEHEGTMHHSELAKHSIDLLLNVNKKMRKALKKLTKNDKVSVALLEENLRKCGCLDDILDDKEHAVTKMLTALTIREGEIYQLQKELKRFVLKDDASWGVDVQYQGLDEDKVHREEETAERLRANISTLEDCEEKEKQKEELKKTEEKIAKHKMQLERKAEYDRASAAREAAVDAKLESAAAELQLESTDSICARGY